MSQVAYKSGFIAVMGRPNVGKSSLINSLLGQKITAVTPRPQTTRKRQMGILTLDNAQVVFVDTPGIHRPRHKLGERMNEEAADTLDSSDLILFVVEANQVPQSEDLLLVNLLRDLKQSLPVILVMNKVDLLDQTSLQSRTQAYEDLLPNAIALPVSATRGDNLDVLLTHILENLHEGAPFFPEDQLTDLYERDLAADLIRESALFILRDEVPHGIAIRIDQYTERGEHGAYIEATLFVERESHKPIVIGQGGRTLKQIGSTSRAKIEALTGRKIFLYLKVKVRKNWRDDEKVLRWFGY